MASPLWLQIIAVFASPAMLGLILYIFSGRFTDVNTRIDDLRNQMQREHDSLASKIDRLDVKIDTLLAK